MSAVRRHDLLLWSSGRIQRPGVASKSRWIQRDLLNIVVTRRWWKWCYLQFTNNHR